MSERRPRKAVSIPSKPTTAQEWVSQGKERAPRAGPTKRLTLDIPTPMHAQLKIRAAREGTTMLELVQSWIAANVREDAERED